MSVSLSRSSHGNSLPVAGASEILCPHCDRDIQQGPANEYNMGQCIWIDGGLGTSDGHFIHKMCFLEVAQRHFDQFLLHTQLTEEAKLSRFLWNYPYFNTSTEICKISGLVGRDILALASLRLEAKGVYILPSITENKLRLQMLRWAKHGNIPAVVNILQDTIRSALKKHRIAELKFALKKMDISEEELTRAVFLAIQFKNPEGLSQLLQYKRVTISSENLRLAAIKAMENGEQSCFRAILSACQGRFMLIEDTSPAVRAIFLRKGSPFMHLVFIPPRVTILKEDLGEIARLAAANGDLNCLTAILAHQPGTIALECLDDPYRVVVHKGRLNLLTAILAQQGSTISLEYLERVTIEAAANGHLNCLTAILAQQGIAISLKCLEEALTEAAANGHQNCIQAIIDYLRMNYYFIPRYYYDLQYEYYTPPG